MSLGSGMESYTPTPSTVIDDGPHRTLRRFDRDTPSTGNPVLLVPPLAAPARCFDLRPGQSLAQFLLDTGRQPYLLDYGEITYADRDLGLDEWTEDILPTAISRIAAEHDRPVEIIGWSLGGVLALVSAANHADLPISSVIGLATPFDQSRTPALLPVRLAAQLTGGREVATAAKLMGGIPKEMVRIGFRVQGFQRELLKPYYVARNILDTEALAQIQAVDEFLATMPGYPGRSFWQIHRNLIVRNELAHGRFRLRSDLTAELAKVTCRVLLVGSRTDVVVPAAAVRTGTRVLTGASEVRFAEVTGGHLGMLAGSGAPDTTWRAIDEFLHA